MKTVMNRIAVLCCGWLAFGVLATTDLKPAPAATVSACTCATCSACVGSQDGSLRSTQGVPPNACGCAHCQSHKPIGEPSPALPAGQSTKAKFPTCDCPHCPMQVKKKGEHPHSASPDQPNKANALTCPCPRCQALSNEQGAPCHSVPP